MEMPYYSLSKDKSAYLPVLDVLRVLTGYGGWDTMAGLSLRFSRGRLWAQS